MAIALSWRCVEATRYVGWNPGIFFTSYLKCLTTICDDAVYDGVARLPRFQVGTYSLLLKTSKL